MTGGRRSWWGWGLEESALAGDRLDGLGEWGAVKAAAAAAIDASGGTATHHHAVGRDHRPGYDRERPELFAQVLRAAKATLDPAGVLNPGVLYDPWPTPTEPA